MILLIVFIHQLCASKTRRSSYQTWIFAILCKKTSSASGGLPSPRPPAYRFFFSGYATDPILLRPILRSNKHPILLRPILRSKKYPILLRPILRSNKHPILLRPILRFLYFVDYLWESDYCLMEIWKIFSYIMARTSYFWWNDHNASFILDLHAYLNAYWNNSLQADMSFWLVTLFWLRINQYLLSFLNCCMLNREAANTNLIVFASPRTGIFGTWGEHSNQCTRGQLTNT